MADPGKPLTAQARETASQELGALYRTALAARETVRSGVPVTAEWLGGEVIAMEKILADLRKVADRNG